LPQSGYVRPLAAGIATSKTGCRGCLPCLLQVPMTRGRSMVGPSAHCRGFARSSGSICARLAEPLPVARHAALQRAGRHGAGSPEFLDALNIDRWCWRVSTGRAATASFRLIGWRVRALTAPVSGPGMTPPASQTRAKRRFWYQYYDDAGRGPQTASWVALWKLWSPWNDGETIADRCIV
jgi:hypothetical protein